MAAVVAVVDPVELVAVVAVVADVDLAVAPVVAVATCISSRHRYDTHGQKFDEFHSHCWRHHSYKSRCYCSWYQ